MASKPSCLCLDPLRCALLIWSVARACALQQLTQVGWQPYRDSKVLNAIYTFVPWKEPGTAEVRQDQKKVAALTEVLFDRMFNEFLVESFLGGPLALQRSSIASDL